MQVPPSCYYYLLFITFIILYFLLGTLEFQLLFPESWLRVQAAITIQRIWRGNKGRKVTQKIYDERLEVYFLQLLIAQNMLCCMLFH